MNKIYTLKNGTCVIWWELDRLTGGTSEDNEEAKASFWVLWIPLNRTYRWYFTGIWMKE